MARKVMGLDVSSDPGGWGSPTDWLLEGSLALKEDITRKVIGVADQSKAEYDKERLLLVLSFFDHYLPRKLIEHHAYGGSADLILSLQEMIDCNPVIDLRNSKHFMSTVASFVEGVDNPVMDFDLLASARTNGTLGDFTARVEGILTVDQSGEWKFSGTMDFYDVWDFDYKGFRSTTRTFQGELKTVLGSIVLPGFPFTIYSQRVPFTQTSSDNHVQWAGGEPVAVPDKLSGVFNKIGEAVLKLDANTWFK